MQLEDWLPIYERILVDFGYNRSDDESSAKYLADFLSERETAGLPMISKIIRDSNILIIGPSINDSQTVELRKRAEEHDAIICADDAIAVCRELGIMPDMIVTDLDGDLRGITKANRLGSTVVVHAHGDNRQALETWLPAFRGKIIGTCQCAPPPPLHNWGGFTDGDRAVSMAAHFGAASITLAGFDFESPVPKEGKDPRVKLKKLKWAEKIIADQDVSFV